MFSFVFFFFFQAEDGIRDGRVTGVQTCALPIYNVGNTISISTIVKVDTTAPSAPAITLGNATGNTFISGTTVFVNAQAGKSGSFTASATSTDPNSGIQKLSFPALAGFSSGGGDDTTSPYGSGTYNWSGAVAASGSQTVTSTNNAGATANSTFTVTPDTTAPTVTASVIAKSAGGSAGFIKQGSTYFVYANVT